MKYVNVLIDNVSDHTDSFFTYKCDIDEVRAGSVVKVPFGVRSRIVKGYVFSVSDRNEGNVKRLKSVREICEDYTIPEDLLELCQWMRQRYMCRYIDAVKCVLPPGSAPKRAAAGDAVPEADERFADEPQLTEEQRSVCSIIDERIDKGGYGSFLINGVTGSGKTEVYLQEVRRVLSKGRDVIVLVPEISLTPQIISRFAARFGRDTIAVMHSRLTKKQRYDQWMRVYDGRARIMIGARSAVFAPSRDLGLIIIDEEHESSYKSDMTPKYDAISTALHRAEKNGAAVILGSATPSVISRYRADHGIYRELRLTKRHNETPLPSVFIADMRKELAEGNRSIFSRVLYQKTRETLDRGRQVIYFLNRRGYSSFVSCRSCGHVIRCDKCGISMTYHKAGSSTECHYCGKKIPVPDTCPECGSKYIRFFGAGTEQVEEAASEAFPDASVARLDLDMTQKKGELNRILNAFGKKKTDILVGTQLVAKGLDYENVGLVGIIAADIMLNIPDYRAAERTYQLLVQASGRAGRGAEKGEVVIQTYSPDDRTIRAAAASDNDAFYDGEINLRRLAGYPPFTNIIRLVFSGENEAETLAEAERIYNNIMESGVPAEGEVMRPQPAYMSKLNERFRFHIIIRTPVRRTELYRRLIRYIKSERIAENDGIIMIAELDPYSFT